MGVLALVAVLGAQQSAGAGEDRTVSAAPDAGRRAELRRAVSRGGRRSAANEIRFGGGVMTVLPLPGEEQAPAWSGARGRGRRRRAEKRACPGHPLCRFYADITWGERRLRVSARSS
ncbi:hypothetical protein ABT263_17945 [Kitasatospora sp. NPDC001603]|uniref:hypothetical protein n=1 Tax=Kitasatospora sp. NPDC001603 TaxID=3154388 RepID=UPI003333D4AA